PKIAIVKKSIDILTQSKNSCRSTPLISLKSSLGIEKEKEKDDKKSQEKIKEIKETEKLEKVNEKEENIKNSKFAKTESFRNPKLMKLAKDKKRDKKSIAETNDPRLKIMNEMKMDNKPRTFSSKISIRDKEQYGSNKSKGTKSILTTNVLSTNYSENQNK